MVGSRGHCMESTHLFVGLNMQAEKKLVFIFDLRLGQCKASVVLYLQHHKSTAIAYGIIALIIATVVVIR